MNRLAVVSLAVLSLVLVACSDDGTSSSSSSGGSSSGTSSSSGASSSSGSTSTSTEKYSCSLNGDCYKCPSSEAVRKCFSESPSSAGCTSTEASFCE